MHVAPVHLGVVADSPEACGEQRSVHLLGVAHEQVEIDGGPQRGIGIAGRYFAAFEHDDRPVAGGTYPLEEGRDGERAHRSFTLRQGEPVRYLAPERAPPSSCEELDAVRNQVAERRRAIDQPVDAAPHLLCAGGCLPRIRDGSRSGDLSRSAQARGGLLGRAGGRRRPRAARPTRGRSARLASAGARRRARPDPPGFGADEKGRET